MKTRLLNYLRCPKCAGPFDLHVDRSEGEEILEGTLRCEDCRQRYPVLRGVPRLVEGTISAEQSATADAFGYEWTHFTQLEDTYEEEFLDWIKPVGKDFFPGRVVLDGGCGKGRHSALSAAFGAADVVGVDISDAVEAAFANTRHLPNVHIVQASIYNLPLTPSFDYAYSIGVLHHLPEPKAGFMSLLGRVKPGGRISAWVYGAEGNWWVTRLVSPIRVLATSRFPRKVTHALSFLLAVPMQIALKLIYRPINRWLPFLKRFLFYNDYLYSISGFSFRENYSTVFDHLVAPTAFYLTREEFGQWFEEARLGDVSITWRNRNSWRGTGVLSASANPAADRGESAAVFAQGASRS